MESLVETAHTSELRPSQEEAERVMQVLQEQGWSVYPERVPLQGQSGYYCVRTVHHPDGSCSKRAHSIRWNLFDDALVPLTICCPGDAELLSFAWRHAGHPGFDYFQYSDNDEAVGFVCYCRAAAGYSLVLRVSTSGGETFSDEAVAMLVAFSEDDEF
jgi:hypothetical protein